MLKSKGIVSLALISLALASTSRADAPLAYKFKQGESSPYLLDNNIAMKLDLNGAAIEIGIQITLDLTFTVKSVADDGSAVIAQKVDRVQLKADNPMSGPFSYDTAGGPEPEGPMWSSMGPSIKAMTSGEFTMKVSPKGEISDVKFPAELEKIVGDQGGKPRRQGGMNLFDKNAIMQTIERSFVPLSGAAPKANETWNKKSENKMPFGTVKTEVTYTYKGPEKKEGKDLLKIDSSSKIAFEPAENSEMDVELGENKGTGSIFFDPAAGKLVESIFNQKTVMNMSNADREITQDMTATSTLKPGKSPNPIPPKAEPKKDEKKPTAEKQSPN